MSDNKPMMVNCGPHGERVATVVCKHMLQSESSPVGFIENSSDPNDLQAWCYLCEEKFQQEDGLTEGFKAFNDMSVVCIVCYNEAKSRHTILTNQ
jgi:hypothetical protein